jgi:predicted Zn-dependent peptidase
VCSSDLNVDHDALVRLVRKYFGRLHGRDVQKSRQPVAGSVQPKTFKEFPRPITQAHICLGTLCFSIKHPHRFPLMVTNTLLGEGMSSRLYQTIRERHGLAYSVYSFVSLLSDTGVFGTYLGTDRKNISSATDLVFHELDKLKRRPVSSAELKRTKSQIKGTLMLGLENMSGRMTRLGSAELYLESYISLDTILKKVDGVTADDVQQVANEVFVQDRFSTVVIRPS